MALCWGDVLDRWYKAFQITEAGVPGSNRVATVSQLDITLKTGKVTMWVQTQTKKLCGHISLKIMWSYP